MAFANLSIELQNIYIQNFDIVTKWVLFIIIIGLSCLYLFYIWPNQKKTGFVTVAMFRIIFFMLSIVYLLVSPYMLMLMHPAYSFYSFYTLPIILYSIGLVILLILVSVDFLKNGVSVLMKLGNVDVYEDNQATEIANQLKNNKHWLK